jgi:hypothetical protein
MEGTRVARRKNYRRKGNRKYNGVIGSKGDIGRDL